MSDEMSLPRRELLKLAGVVGGASVLGSGTAQAQSIEDARVEEIPGANQFVLEGLDGEPYEISQTQVDQVRVEDHVSFFDHTFARPNAPDTKNWDFTASEVTKDNSEVKLASTAVLQTNQRGNYPPGTEANPGLAFRVDGVPTAGSAYCGYFNPDDGFGAGEDTKDSFVFIRKGGTDYKVYREDWNGFVPNNRVWVNDSPVITRLPHLFYGGGGIRIRAIFHVGGQSYLRTLHRFTPDNLPDSWGDGPPFDQPNLPVRFEANSLTGGAVRANAAHYEFGEQDAENRINGEHFGPISVPDTEWVPLISWRKRSGWEMVNISPHKLTPAASTNDIRLELQLGSTLSSPTWDLPTHTSPSETAVEVAIGGSLTSHGERRWPGFAAAGQGNNSSTAGTDDLDFNLPGTQVATLAAKAVGGSAEASGAVGWAEMF